MWQHVECWQLARELAVYCYVPIPGDRETPETRREEGPPVSECNWWQLTPSTYTILTRLNKALISQKLVQQNEYNHRQINIMAMNHLNKIVGFNVVSYISEPPCHSRQCFVGRRPNIFETIVIVTRLGVIKVSSYNGTYGGTLQNNNVLEFFDFSF